MRKYLLFIFACIHISTFGIEEIPSLFYTKSLFEDDFSSEKLSRDWKSYKSKTYVKDGVFVGVEEPNGGHDSVNSVVLAPFKDVEVSLRFKFVGSPLFKVTFNDSKCKEVHAGHICRVMIYKNRLRLMDGKTGTFRKDIHDLKKKGPLDKKTKQYLKTKEKNFNYEFEENTWYKLAIRIKGNEMQAYVDGKFVGSFTSEGIGHATKNKPAIVVDKQEMHIDDFKVRVP
ncbi:MAG: DUF1080 domain-containing protein [Lentisphaeraceae bacterium]|nr:DUF1080 domain-containing protein [Lentisphaeraceae bacterium]